VSGRAAGPDLFLLHFFQRIVEKKIFKKVEEKAIHFSPTRVNQGMKDYQNQISGWLMASGNSLLDTLPSGSGICRIVEVAPQKYSTGYVSIGGGSFKLPNESGNWYGTDFVVAVAETQPKTTPIYECSVLKQNTPVWNMHKLPAPFLTAIYNDRDLVSGKFEKSQFIIKCLQTAEATSGVSGVYFPSRKTDGGVIVLNPQAVGINIVYTGQSPPIVG